MRTNFAWVLAGHAVTAAAYMGILMGLARIGSAELVGQFALGMAFTSPIMMLTNLQLRMVQATDAGGKFAFGDYLGVRITTGTAALVLAGALPFLFGYGWFVTGIIAAVTLAKVADSLGDVVYGAVQRRERMDLIAKSMIIRGPLLLLTVVGGVWLTKNTVVGALCWVVGSCLVLLMFDVPRFRKCTDESLAARFTKEKWLGIFRLGFPLGIALLGTTLILNIPRYLVERYQGMEELGIFAVLGYFVQAEHLVVAALSYAIVPRLAQYYQAGEMKKFRKVLLMKMGIVFSFCLAGLLLVIFFGREIVLLFYPPEFAARNKILILLMLAAIPWEMALSLGNVLTAQRKTGVQFFISCVVVAAIILLGLWLIPQHGLTGATMAMLGASSLHLAANLTALCFYKPQKGAIVVEDVETVVD